MLGIRLPDDLNKPITYILRDTKLLDLFEGMTTINQYQ